MRETIIAAAITALNTGTPGGVPAAARSRETSEASSALPSITVYPVREVPEQIGGRGGPLVRSRLTFNVEVRARGSAGVTADAAADASLAWIVKSLGGKQFSDGSGGWLNHDIEEGETTWEYERGEFPLVIAVMELVVVYQHLVSDAEARA